MRSQKLQVLDLHGMTASDLAHDAWNGVRMTGPIERGSGMIEVDAVERGCKPVRVAFAADFAVCDDVEAGTLLCANSEQRGVVLRFR